MKEKLLAALKAKYKSLGFSDKAIAGVLGYLEKTVTEEDKIDEAVDGVEDLLKAFQAEVDSRVSTAVAKAKAPAGDPQKKEGNDPNPDTPANPPADAPEWAKGLLTTVQTLAQEVSTLKSGKTADTRKSQLEDALKDSSDAFKKITLKNFDLMNFDTDEKFNAFLESVKEDSADFVQTEANNGLSQSKPPVKSNGSNTKTASKEEIDRLVKNIG
ncbi:MULTISPECIES: hypothetical protein [unclassified Spirosoma]|uniref:hypothetical protein n=1 Tax=unclassified Spirosoma TaxID=2621999 RepID=UPI000967701C|nr:MULTISPECIES: hypothetical protein [unclassified Spirosoma]MBN8821281.1 hypothetical protein [Spirosoma sp.]OJW78070.1 MAG: hypothetical protein BGO59_29060 [Spirosoma sp. 48-14]